MKTMEDAIEHICDLKGSVIAMTTFTQALLKVLPPDALKALAGEYDAQVEAMRVHLLNAKISEKSVNAFERDVRGVSATIQARLALLF